MIKRLLIALLAFVSCLGLNAQTNPPDAFVYQGLAKNPGTGGIASNTKVRLKVQVLQGGPTGPMVFEEHHNTTTNADGIFSVLVGRGIKLAVTTYSSLYDIPWSQDSFYFSMSMSIAMKFPPNSYSPYLPIGTQQFFSVPYAMFAKEAQSVLDTLSIAAGGNYRFLQLGSQKPVVFYVGDGDTSALNELQELVRLGGRMGLKNADGSINYTVSLPDSSSTNELQTISQMGNIITLSKGGGSVTFVDNDKQTLSLIGNTVYISNGNSITLNTNDADSDPTNELQTISKSGTTISLNKSGGSITDSDNQTLSVSGSTLSISSGNSVILPDGSSTNELQTLGQTSSKGTITLSQGGGKVILPDSSASNELQNLSLSGASLSISSGNNVILPDGSSTNEIQTLGQTSSKGTITLSQGGGKVILPDSSASNEIQNLSITGANLSISSGNTVVLPDASSSNELQTLSKSGSSITLSNSGGSVLDSDEQTLTLSGNILSISNGNSVTINTNDSDSNPYNEIQKITKTGNTITLSQNGGSITDSDAQTLSINGNTLSISNGNSVTIGNQNSNNTQNQNGPNINEMYFGYIYPNQPTTMYHLNTFNDTLYFTNNRWVYLHTKDTTKKIIDLGTGNNSLGLLNRNTYAFGKQFVGFRFYDIDTGLISGHTGCSITEHRPEYSYTAIDKYNNIISLQTSGTYNLGKISYYNYKKDTTIMLPFSLNGKKGVRCHPQIINDSLILISTVIWKYNQDTMIENKQVISTQADISGNYYIKPLVVSNNKILTQFEDQMKLYNITTKEYHPLCKCGNLGAGYDLCKIFGVSDNNILIESQTNLGNIGLTSTKYLNTYYWINIETELSSKFQIIGNGNPKRNTRTHPNNIIITNGIDGNFPNVNNTTPESGYTYLNP